MTKQISGQRKIAHYLGMALMGIGALLFFSVFVTGAMNCGNFSNFEANARSGLSRAFGGIAPLVVGGIICGIGARGLAGSGVVLDPEQARRELEPYTRMAGGLVKDALGEANLDPGGKSAKGFLVRCSACGKLNEEDSKLCQECGGKICADQADARHGLQRCETGAVDSSKENVG